MDLEKGRVYTLINESLLEVNLIIDKNQNLSGTSSLDYFYYIKETLEILKFNAESYQKLDKQVLDRFENVVSMSVRGLENTIINEKITELGDILMNYGLFSEFQEF